MRSLSFGRDPSAVFLFGHGKTEWDEVLTGPPLGNEGDFVVTLP